MEDVETTIVALTHALDRLTQGIESLEHRVSTGSVARQWEGEDVFFDASLDETSFTAAIVAEQQTVTATDVTASITAAAAPSVATISLPDVYLVECHRLVFAEFMCLQQADELRDNFKVDDASRLVLTQRSEFMDSAEGLWRLCRALYDKGEMNKSIKQVSRFVYVNLRHKLCKR